MRITIDRFEDGYAVVELENGTLENMPITLIPQSATQGSIIDIIVNSDETEDRRIEMKKKMNSIFKK